jgi:type III restriction enzyme
MDMVDPQPTLVELLVRHALLLRELLPQIEINSNYLNALQVHKSVYEYVVYDSEVERAFASQLDAREDIKLFVKLPGWFQIDTPIGTYNPDWAILKHDGQALYLVRETKGTKDFLRLRTSEADKIRCGQQHFETIGVPFAVAVSADEV